MASNGSTDTPESAPARITTRCPSCREIIAVEFRAFLTGLQVKEVGPEVPFRDTLPEEQRIMLEESERNGTLAAFLDATPRIMTDNAPANLERYLLSWLRACVLITPTEGELYALRDEFGSNHIETYAHGRMMGVVVNDRLRAFVPYISNSKGGAKTKTQRETKPFQRVQVLQGWMRSRYGYLAGAGAFFRAMRSNRTKGDFGRLVQ